MTFLFWTFWIFDLLLLALTVMGKNFRSGFGAGVDLNVFIIAALLIVLVAGQWVWVVVKSKGLGLVIAGLPLLAVMIFYVIDTLKAGQN